MGWGGRLDGPGQQGVMGQRWWVAWEEGGAGVNIVMISPEFRSSRPMRRERERERAAAVLSPLASTVVVTPPPPSPPPLHPQNNQEKRGMVQENRNADTHTRTHMNAKQPQRAPLIIQLES